MQKLFLLLGLLLFTFPSLGATDIPQFPVEIRNYSDDNVGSQLVYKVEEDVKSSQSMIDTTSRFPRFQVRISTIAVSQDSDLETAYSVVIVLIRFKGDVSVYWDSTIGVCGSARVSNCADGIVSFVGKDVDWIVNQLKKSSN